MSNTPAQVSDKEIRQFKTDGATLIRGALSSKWQQILEDGVERIYAKSGPYTTSYVSSGGLGKMLIDQYPHLRDEGINAFVRHSPIAEITAKLMQVKTLHFVYEQVYYRPEGLMIPMPWHQSAPYLSCSGHNIARVWVSCDKSPKELSFRVIRGSHLWNVFYRPVILPDAIEEVESSEFAYASAEFDDSLPIMPDFDKYPDSFEIISWDLEPGDVLVFNANTIHASGGGIDYQSPQRGIGVFFGADDVIYDKHSGFPDLAEIKGVSATPGSPISECPEVFFPVPQSPLSNGEEILSPLDTESLD